MLRLLFSWLDSFCRPRPPHYRAFVITVEHTTPNGTPLCELSARSRRPLRDNTPHSQETNKQVPSGIRTRNPSKRAAADPRFRPRGHWNRPRLFNPLEITSTWHYAYSFTNVTTLISVDFCNMYRKLILIHSDLLSVGGQPLLLLFKSCA